MVNDQEPRYRLVDADGNVVGSLFAESDGTLKLQEGTSGNDNELAFSTQGSLAVKQLAGDRYFTASFSGSDPDTRLDNALSAAADGDTILLEDATFNADRTVSKDTELVGSGGGFSGVNISNCTWTFSSPVSLRNVVVSANVSLDINAVGCIITQCELGGLSSVSVSEDRFRFVNNEGGDLTFGSGTKNGIVDACTNTTVTDNGGNSVGNVS